MKVSETATGYIHRSYIRNAHAPGCVRKCVRNRLLTTEFAPLADTAELIASELVTNAIQAGRRAIIKVRLEFEGRAVLFHVWDDNEDEFPRLRKGDDEHGRGLHLVTALSAEWNWYRDTANGGKWVWTKIISEN
jgi:anti-sigma regulatory factor (Ser/Thr protein kinase)